MPRSSSIGVSAAPPLTTARRLATVLKAARDIMRKDKGLSGDVDRLPMITWVMFLKFLDDLEIQREEEAKLSGKGFKQAIEPPYRWRDWAINPRGMTGDELMAFVNQEKCMRPDGSEGLGLFAYLRRLSSANGDNRRDVIAVVFRGIDNRMRSGYLLREVVNKISEIQFTSSEELHTLSGLYEVMLREMRDAAGDSGEFYTPRPIVRFMVEMTEPRVGELVLDPACGTGGFLVEAFLHLARQVRTVEQRRKLQADSLIGFEAKPLPFLLCQMNLLLHGLESPNIDPGNALRWPLTELGERERVDVILSNPPFGGEEERGILANFPPDAQTTETAVLFLQLILRRLRRASSQHPSGGRSAVVVPDGVLSDLGPAAVVRCQLLSDFNLHTIVQLPPGAFAPYAETARTNILFFDSGSQQDYVWYYQVPAPDGKKSCSKTSPLRNSDFEPVAAWWRQRAEGPRSWRVKRESIASPNWNLLVRNPAVLDREGALDASAALANLADRLESAARDLRSVAHRADYGSATLKPLSLLLKRSMQPVEVKDSESYLQLTVQYHHRGVKARGRLLGSQIATKRQFLARAGQLVLSRIDARFGALGLVPDDLDGAIVTGDYWVFDIDTDEVEPQYLDLLIGLPEFAELCEKASRGTTRRQRLEFEKFVALQVPCLEPVSRAQLVTSIGTVSAALEGIQAEGRSPGQVVAACVRQVLGAAWIEDNANMLHAMGMNGGVGEKVVEARRRRTTGGKRAVRRG